MKLAGLVLCGILLCVPAFADMDSDRDGVPDNLDKTPRVAHVYQGTAVERPDPLAADAQTDTDKDGVPDNLDNSPYVAEYYKTWVPPVPKPVDTDGDGVVDKSDACPDTPTGVAVDASGCPIDSDGDGVADYLDKCPGTPAGVKVDANGCTVDSDGDGVTDDKDKCPGTPQGATVDATGCPVDTDGDGVFDYLDKCPGTAAGIPVDETGCPKLIKKGEKIILDVNFATNSAELDASSEEVLAGVAKTLIDFPEIRIAIRGYTDNQGSESHNRQLSDRRAKSVMAYLQTLGVDGDRMTAKGFGEDPQYFIADNDTPEGRAQNRRVEIESVE